MNGLTGAGISNARVTLGCITVNAAGALCTKASETSRRDGGFRFEEVQAGTYPVIAGAPGFVVRSGAATPVAIVTASAATSSMVVKLIPTASIAGVVVDENSRGVPGAKVRALMERFIQGKLRPIQMADVVTGANGEFSLSDLRPGRYYLAAELPGQPVLFFSPGVLRPADSEAVDAQSGQAISGVQVATRPIQTPSISGTVIIPPGAADFGSLKLQLSSAEAASFFTTRAISPGVDGHFAFENIGPGDYFVRLVRLVPATLDSKRPGPAFQQIIASESVTLGTNDVAGMVLSPASPISITGHIVAEAESAMPLGTQVDLEPEEQDGVVTVTLGDTTDPQGNFRFDSLQPVRYFINVTDRNERYVESIEFNRSDATNRPIDLSSNRGGDLVIKLRRGSAEVTGILENATSIPDAEPGNEVVLIPDTWSREAFRDLHPIYTRSKEFSMQNLRPGKYRAIAIPALPQRYWENPNFIDLLKGEGVSLELHEGEHANLPLTAIEPSRMETVLSRIGL